MKKLSSIYTGLWILIASSVGANPHTLKQDVQVLLTWENSGIVALGMGAAGMVHRWDDNLVGQAENNPILKATAGPSNIYGSSTFNLTTTLGLWLISKAAQKPNLEAVSSDLLRALLWNQALVFPIKLSARRNRPDGSNQLSFPSGHTANAFAIAGVLHKHYGPRAGIPLYAWSVLVGGGRMKTNRHFLSDVVAGAAIGLAVGRSISQTEPQQISLLPVPLSKGLMLVLTFKK